MLTMVFDTETTGFPLWTSPIEDERQPHLVQLAVIMTKEDEILHKWDTIVKCPVEVSEGALNVHGIDKERSQREGISPNLAVTKFDDLLRSADRTVCHNVNFDFRIMKYAYHRAGIDKEALNSIMSICTMKTTKPLLKLSGKRGYKWPKLMEAYKALVDVHGFEAAHSADADAMACWKVLRVLERRGVELL